MRIVRASTKGQVVIPVDMRRRKGIKGGTYVGVTETDDEIVLRRLSDDLVDAAYGMFADLGPLTPGLEEERRRERDQEERDLPPPCEDAE